MDPIQLFLPDGKPVRDIEGASIFICSKCRVIRRGEDNARQCCACLKCGAPERTSNRIHCKACQDLLDRLSRDEQAHKAQDRLGRAEKVDAWDGWVFPDHGPNDGYHESLEAYTDWLQEEEVPVDEWPEFVHLAKGESRQLDLGRIIENAYDDMFEDFEVDDLKGMDALQAAVDAFNEANKGLLVYNPDYRRAVAVPRP